ncbi:hypothetical protein [uncultured Methylobacterium sp.]|jgi:hypothetical protein|uniref:hypothetical protein n=1 Tax=uncultured Methylobacterium sp. TaxID=157278 RepID=UPI002617D940|nr:hypothetical protein [uncultured Methylobacterium sp.]
MHRFVLPFLVAAGFSAPALAQQPGLSGRPPALLVHGNYCGPGNNAPLPPVDALDAACARHDACTPRGGLPSRACNARLQREAELISRDPRQPDDLRAMAGFIAVGVGMIPSGSGFAAAPSAPVPVGGMRPATHAPALFDDPDAEEGDD